MNAATATKKPSPAKAKRPVAKIKEAAHGLPAADLIPALRWVNLARSRDETRPHLCSVMVEIEAKCIRLIGTDSYRIHIAEIPIDSNLKFKGYVGGMMQGVHADALLREFPIRRGKKKFTVPFGHVRIEVKGGSLGHVVSTTAHRFTLSSSVDGRFPDWNQLIPADDELVTDGKLDIRAIGTVRSNRYSPLALEPCEGGHRLVFPPFGEGAIGFNIDFLLATFSEFVAYEQTVRVRTISPFRPILIEPKEGYRALVMPVRLNS